MSDYSPPPSPNAFDELEDLLYDADPAPDLADELASHALHSPLLYAQDFEPGYELQEYFSDWEYYSDDYYDDDPTILRKHPIDGDSPSRKEKTDSGRGKKRKLAERDSGNVVLKERRFLKDTLRGTVWATPVPVRNNIYTSGQDEKVALLKDWKERFGTATPRSQTEHSKRPPKLPQDESWANDLSLADMGLLNERGTRTEQQADRDDEGDDEVGPDEADANEDEPRLLEELNLDDLDIDEEALEMIKAAAEQAARDGTLGELDAQQLASLRALTQRPRALSPNTDDNDTPMSSTIQADDEAEAKPSKRRKKNIPVYKGASLPPIPPTSSPTTQNTVLLEAEIPPTSTTTSHHSRKRKASASPSPPPVEDNNEEATSTAADAEAGTQVETTNTEQPTKPPIATRKAARTATKSRPTATAKGSATATATATGSTASSRAKSAAAKPNAKNADGEVNGRRPAAEPVAAAAAVGASGPARATRSRKKI